MTFEENFKIFRLAFTLNSQPRISDSNINDKVNAKYTLISLLFLNIIIYPYPKLTEKSWFETGSEETILDKPEESPSAVAGGAPQHNCALCGDRFHQFYNEDKEEWHLRNAVLYSAMYYHPLCLQDYKVNNSHIFPFKYNQSYSITNFYILFLIF